jgi:hypothetical protein
MIPGAHLPCNWKRYGFASADIPFTGLAFEQASSHKSIKNFGRAELEHQCAVCIKASSASAPGGGSALNLAKTA